MVSICQSVVTDGQHGGHLLWGDWIRQVLISSATAIGSLSWKVGLSEFLYHGRPGSPTLAARASFCCIFFQNLMDSLCVTFQYFHKQCSEQVVSSGCSLVVESFLQSPQQVSGVYGPSNSRILWLSRVGKVFSTLSRPSYVSETIGFLFFS